MKQIEHYHLPVTVEKTDVVEPLTVPVFVEGSMRVELVHMVEIIFLANLARNYVDLEEHPRVLEKHQAFYLAVDVNRMHVFEALVKTEFVSPSVLSVIVLFLFENHSQFARKCSLEVGEVADKGVEIVEMLVLVRVVQVNMVLLDSHLQKVQDVLIWKEILN